MVCSEIISFNLTLLYKNMEFKNLYEVTRSIRFRLEDNENILKPVFSENEANEQDIFKDFQIQYSLLLDAFRDSVFFENKEGEQKVKSKLEVKYPWLRKFANKEYYNPEFKKETKKYTIAEAHFLYDVFMQWLDKNEELESQIKNIISRPEENQVKRADLATLIKVFFGVDYFFFAQEFVEYANDKNSNQYLDELKDSTEKIKVLAENALSVLVPDQNNGMEIARASFNFYTVNKISKNFDSDFNQEKEKLNKHYAGIIDTNLLKKIGLNNYLQVAKDKKGSLIYNTSDLSKFSIENFYKALKEFKAQQKSAFMELIAREKWRNNNEEKIEPIKTKNTANIDLQKGQGKQFASLNDLGAFFGIKAEKVLPKKKHSPKEDAKMLKKYV